jgi:hypothetical protein
VARYVETWDGEIRVRLKGRQLPAQRERSSWAAWPVTQIINALRGHLAEFGIVVAKGPAYVPHLVQAVEAGAKPVLVL